MIVNLESAEELKRLRDIMDRIEAWGREECEPKYIDLGLSSGTLWSNRNEVGYWTFEETLEEYDDCIPTKEQWQELIKECTWSWDSEKGEYNIIGPNGSYIMLPAKGYYENPSNTFGRYWTLLVDESFPGNAWAMYFNHTGPYFSYNDVSERLSMRTVKNG